MVFEDDLSQTMLEPKLEGKIKARQQFSTPRYSPSLSIATATGSKALFIQPGNEAISFPVKERTTFPDIPLLNVQVNDYSQLIDMYVKPCLIKSY